MNSEYKKYKINHETSRFKSMETPYTSRKARSLGKQFSDTERSSLQNRLKLHKRVTTSEPKKGEAEEP